MDRETFITLQSLAQRLGLPAAWLKSEAEAGRIPSLRAGRRLAFNHEQVEAALLRRDHDKEPAASVTRHARGVPGLPLRRS